MFEVGSRLGIYQVLTRLSVGGMAEIFLALAADNAGIRMPVTLKRILPELRELDEFVKMFMDEARISAALSHRNIAQVFELGQDEGELFIAMEFIPGQSLTSLLQACRRAKRPVPLGFAAMIGRDLCRALDFAHHFTQRGEPSPVIHRDVSPNNVMVTYTGQVKVIDFGVAKAKGSLSRTSTGAIKGSHGYMSPEQARGAPLDPRSDIFSAGVVLHELLTGRPLFLKDSELLTFRGILRDEIRTPISQNPGVPRALSDVVMKALDRSPSARFSTAAEMAGAIETSIPALLYREEQAAEVMGELFAERLKQTRALIELAGPQADPRSLAAAAETLREAPRSNAGSGGLPRPPATDAYGPLPTGVMRLGEVPPEPEPGPAAPEEAVVEGAIVLTVDDSEISRQFIEAHLEGSGFPVLQCGSADQVFELLGRMLPDLILLDVVMPDVDGFELCRRIRARCAKRPFLPILFVSSQASLEERLTGLAAGGDDFLSKPFQPEHLVGLVRAHLQRAAFLGRLASARPAVPPTAG
ncbi:MAG: protein kinase domain-containing protein [Myxococcaceae bacterium]